MSITSHGLFINSKIHEILIELYEGKVTLNDASKEIAKIMEEELKRKYEQGYIEGREASEDRIKGDLYTVIQTYRSERSVKIK